jgi:hypothetical protein
VVLEDVDTERGGAGSSWWMVLYDFFLQTKTFDEPSPKKEKDPDPNPFSTTQGTVQVESLHNVMASSIFCEIQDLVESALDWKQCCFSNLHP